MRYKAKIFKSDKRKMRNGKTEFFSIINKPSAFLMKRISKSSRKTRKKYET